MSLKDMSAEELRKLAAMLQPQAEEKAPTALPTPQVPENYTDDDAERDQKEFAGPEAIADEPEADDEETEDGIPREVASTDEDNAQGDIKPTLADDDAEDDPRPALDDESSMEDELADSSADLDKKQDLDKDGNPVPETAVADQQVTPEEAAALAARQPASTDAQPQAPLKPGSPEYMSDLMKRFKAAQDQSNVNRALTDFGKYAYAGGTSFRGVQANPQILNALEEQGKRANLPVEQFGQQLQVEGQDPNSPASNAMRTAYSQALGVDPSKLANMNTDQMEKSFKFLGDNANNKIKAQAAQLAAQTKQLQAQTASKKVDQQAPLIQSQVEQNNAKAEYLKQKPGIDAQKIAAMKEKQANQQSEKQKASDEKEIAKAAKEANGYSASSRSVIGNAEKIKQGGKRMISILDDPGATAQDMQSAYADMNGMISGNTTMSGTEHAAYNSLATEYAKGIQFITGHPQDANIPQIKAHMKDVAANIMKLSDQVQKNQLQRVYAGRASIFERNPGAWDKIVSSMNDAPDSSTPAAPKGGKYDGSTPLPPNASDSDKQARIQFLKAKAGQ